MNKYAKAVLWIGFLLIAMGIVARWSEISGVLFGSGSWANTKVPGQVNPGPGVAPPGKGGRCPPGFYSVVLPSGRKVCYRRPLGR